MPALHAAELCVDMVDQSEDCILLALLSLAESTQQTICTNWYFPALFQTLSFLYRTKRAWRPNVQKKRYYSYILGTKLQLRVTCAAMRCIDKAGGFDSYIYHTPDKKLGSKLGSALKRRMFAIVKKYPDIQPPPLVKRYPRPPRSLQTETVSAAGSADTRTREINRNFKQDLCSKGL